MINKQEILAILKKEFPDLQRFKVQSVFVFGSVIRDEASAESDVDILVEFSQPIGLFEFIRLQKHLENLLHRPVDLVTSDALKSELKDQILKEAIRAA